MTDQHTSLSVGRSGGWLYRPERHDDWGIVREAQSDEYIPGYVVCQVRVPYADDAAMAQHRANGTDPWEEGARLAAAAPDMLAALVEIEEDIRCAAGCDDDLSEDQIDSYVMSWGGSPMAVGYQRVRAAIAQATNNTISEEPGR